MPSNSHEVPLELIRDNPQVGIEAARTIHRLELPDGAHWKLGPETVSATSHTELHKDLTLICSAPDQALHALIHEVQIGCTKETLGRIRYAWPLYAAHTGHTYKCPVTLLAFCATEKAARKITAEFEAMPGCLRLQALTYWPALIRRIDTVDEAKQWPELVIMRACRDVDDTSPEVLDAALAELGIRYPDKKHIYFDYISCRISDETRKSLEDLMTISHEGYEWESDFARKHQAEGEARGEAKGIVEAIFTLLRFRKIEVTPEQESTISACRDLERLRTWMERATTITATGKLFEG